MQPKLQIGNTDFTALVAGITPSKNDLDADGSGRDISNGEMHRSKVAEKIKFDVSMMRLWEDDVTALYTALNHNFVSVQLLNPSTNTIVTKNMYCSSINYGLQIYSPKKAKTYYEGVSFSLAEK